MKPLAFHPEAESEMNDAASWYEDQQPGLGKRLLASIEDAVNRIGLSPGIYQFVDEDVRRCLTRTFPFGILFRNGPEVIEILAVMHLHREPGYWKHRRAE
jgi:plasmid stabilization system protein ParE